MSFLERFEYSYRQLPSVFYSENSLEVFPRAQQIFWNHAVTNLYELPISASDELKSLFQNNSPQILQPLSMAYHGHQFGHLNALGDGRAHLIGEWTTPNQTTIDFHTKGSGKSIYSRGGDGYAAIGPMIKEIFFSEFLHSLNIPTTRTLAVYKTNQPVFRNQVEDGALLLRTAQSHIRIGTFQLAANQGPEAVQSLVDFTIERLKTPLLDDNKSLSLLNEVTRKLAILTAQWMAYGFIHGVLNTDNILISGETIDFGPCAFINQFDLTKTFSSIDSQGRYAFGNQPAIMEWNLTRFAETLLPLLHQKEAQAIKIAQAALSQFKIIFENEYFEKIAYRIGLPKNLPNSKKLILDLLQILDSTKYDYNQFFLDLINESLPTSFSNWLNDRMLLLQNHHPFNLSVIQMMNANPQRIPRLKLVQEVTREFIEKNNIVLFNEFVESLQDPFTIKDKWTVFNSESYFSDLGLKTFCGT